jgi:hypothetical protein
MISPNLNAPTTENASQSHSSIVSPPLDLSMARQFVELITGSADTAMLFRFVHDQDKRAPALEARGTVTENRPRIEAVNREGYAAYAVVNEGAGYADKDIAAVRVLFIDKDGAKHGPEMRWQDVDWHVLPDFQVIRSDTHWHAYWLVRGLPVERFKDAQHRLAGHYLSDPSVCNAARIMRLPGTLHQKAGKDPSLVTLHIPDHTKVRLSLAAELEDIL